MRLGLRSKGFVLAALLAAAAGAAPAAGQGIVHRGLVTVTAEFRHFVMPVAPSLFSHWRGELDLTLIQETFGSRLLLPLGLGDQACRLFSSWSLPAQSGGTEPTTGPVEMCITTPGASASQVNAWVHGQTAPDPLLSVPMMPSGPNTWTNTGPIDARLFIRDCRNDQNNEPGPVRSTVQVARQAVESTLRTVGGLSPVPVTGTEIPPTSTASTRPTKPFVHFGEFSLPSGSVSAAVSPTTGAMSVSATAGVVSSTDPTVWSQIRAECGNAHIALPDNPRTGTLSFLSSALAGSGRPGSTGTLRGILARDAEDALLIRADAAVLTEEVDQANDHLALALPARGITELQELVELVDTMLAQGRMTSATALAIRSEAQSTILAIGDRMRPPSERPPDPPPPGICEVPSNDYTEFHVDSRAARGFVIAPDGSEENPFRTIGTALARADALDVDGVKLLVAPGFYVENLEIHRDTKIVGESGAWLFGGIQNSTGSLLKLESFRIRDSDRPGGIVVDHPCAETVLDDVEIQNAEFYGIWQRNGRLSFSNGAVVGTRAGMRLVSQGTGIYLTGGVRADLGNVLLADNTSGGLIAQGNETALTAENVDVVANAVNEFFATLDGPCLFNEGAGGVVARFGAVMSMSDSLIAANLFLGLAAFSEGTEVTLADTFVETTRQFADCGGFNISAFDNSHVALNSVTTMSAELCGLMIATDGAIDYRVGWIFDNPIGACVQVEGYDIDRLQRATIYRDNDVNLDSTTLTVPTAAEF